MPSNRIKQKDCVRRSPGFWVTVSVPDNSGCLISPEIRHGTYLTHGSVAFLDLDPLDNVKSENQDKFQGEGHANI